MASIRRISLGYLLGLGLISLKIAAASVVTFDDRDVFTAAVSGLEPILENWSELPGGTILTNYNGITYRPGSAGDQAITTSSANFICNACSEGLGSTVFGYFAPMNR